MNQTKKVILILLLIAVVAIAVWFVLEKGLFKRESAEVLPPAPQYVKTDLSNNKIPEAFPKDLIQEENPKILESYSANIEKTTFEAAKAQYSIKFLSSKSAAENQKLYSNFLKSAGWGFISQTKSETEFHIRAVKNTEYIYVDSTSSNSVEIVLVQLQIN